MAKGITIALALTVMLLTQASVAAAAPSDTGLVIPGKSINGIELRESKASVRASRPFGFAAPHSSAVSETAIGKILTETWMDPENSGVAGVPGVHSFAVTYFPAKTMKIKGKVRKPRVVHITTGQGVWYDPQTFVRHSEIQDANNSTPADVAEHFPCSFYQVGLDGQRTYDPGTSDGQYCELLFGELNYFYFTFNHGGPAADVPARLAGFTMSKFQID